MKKTLLLLLALVGLVTLQAQVPYQRISTPPLRLRQNRLTTRDTSPPVRLQKLLKWWSRVLMM